MKSFCVVVAVAAVSLMSNLAKAQTDLVNTGTPTGGAFVESDSSQSFAAEFSIQSGQTITSIAPYLTLGGSNAQPGESFTLDIYATLPGRNGAGGVLDYTVTGQWEADGFTPVTTNWTASNTGDYWVAVVNSNSATNFLDLEDLASASTGDPAALGFEWAGSSGSYSASGAPSFGLEIVATPEPASWALSLVCVGALGVLYLWRRPAIRA